VLHGDTQQWTRRISKQVSVWQVGVSCHIEIIQKCNLRLAFIPTTDVQHTHKVFPACGSACVYEGHSVSWTDDSTCRTYTWTCCPSVCACEHSTCTTVSQSQFTV